MHSVDAYTAEHPAAEVAKLMGELHFNEQNMVLYAVSKMAGRYIGNQPSPTPATDAVRVLPFLSHDQARAALLFAQRTLDGQTRYAPISFTDDDRNFVRERAEEIVDALAYESIDFYSRKSAPRDDVGVLRALEMTVRSAL